MFADVIYGSPLIKLVPIPFMNRAEEANTEEEEEGDPANNAVFAACSWVGGCKTVSKDEV